MKGAHVADLTSGETTIFLVLPATVETLPDVVNALSEGLEEHGCPHPTVDRLVVAVEELYVNVAHYAYPEDERPGEARVTIEFSGNDDEGHCVAVTIEDEGIPFDPVAKKDPTLPHSVEEVKIGGLGILMVKRMTDTFTYERRGDSNVTTITKCW